MAEDPTDATDPERGSSERPIVGGVVDPGHPYTVGVGNFFSAYCSGTVISRRTVLTAGHCGTGTSRVMFGPKSGFGAQRIKVVEAVRHPGYDGQTVTNDLMLLRLEQDAPVQPAPLLRETLTNTPDFIGPDFTWVGYGITSSAGGGAGTKRVVTFPIMTVGPATVGGSVGEIDATMFYYRPPGENTCSGDSGGPAFVIRNRVERHAGVTSYGDGPCELDGVQQRSDAPSIAEFIQPTIDRFEGTDPCRSNGVCDESCNTGGKLVDPDCAENHCGADGLCAVACVAPMDPDCASDGINHCSNDGVCDPSCAPLDVDCAALCSAEGACIPGCVPQDPDCGGGGDTVDPTARLLSPAKGDALHGAVTFRAEASDNVGVTRVEFFVDGAAKGSAAQPPYEATVDTAQLPNGSHTLSVSAVDAAGNVGLSAPVTVTVSNAGGGGAAYDEQLKAPRCGSVATACDSDALLKGRGTVGPEPHQPNTLTSAQCGDGVGGNYQVDESVERIKVSSVDGGPLTAGNQARVDVTVWAYSTSLDKLDIYTASDARNPSWTLLATLSPTQVNESTLSATFTLPAGNLQAVRASLRYRGSPSPCGTGGYNDHDDLAFTVQ